MKIVFTRFPFTSAKGGAENQTINLMEGLVAAGHAVSFLGSCPVLNELCQKRSLPRAELEIGKPPVTKLGAITFTWRKFAMQQKLKAALQELKDIDAICMLSLTEKILLTPIALKHDIKVVWIEHDMVGNWLTKNPWLPKLKAMSNHVTTVCVSELSANIFCNLGYGNVVAIPNGVPSPDGFVSHTFDETLRLGCIARLSKEKGVDLLAEAVRSSENTTVLIVGKGDLHIPTSPVITVKADVPDINTIYEQIDVLVLPSRQEDPFGLVVAEAMLRGIAVICTDACGVASYLQDEKHALVVPAGDQAALQHAIKLMQQAKLRTYIAEHGQQLAQQMFTIEKMVEKYSEVLSSSM